MDLAQMKAAVTMEGVLSGTAALELIAEVERLTALCDGYRGEVEAAKEPPTCFDDWWKSTKYGLPHWGQPHIFMPLDIGRDSFAAGYRMGKKERQSSHPRTHHQGDSDES